MLNRNRNAGGYMLASHPQGELTSNEVNMLHDLAKILSLGVAAEEMQIQRFVTTVPAAGTTDVTFATTIDQCKVIGGYAKIKGVDADYDFDIGKTNDLDCFINDFNSGSSSDATKELPLDPTYLVASDDVVLTIASNSNTGPVTVEIVLLCMHDTQFKPNGIITADVTLTKLDSGTTYFLGTNSGAVAITLPSVENGLNFKFIVENDTPVNAITIAAGSAIIFGNIAEAEVDTGDDGPGSSAATGVSNVIIGTAANTGDWIEFLSDGTNWYICGLTQLDGSVTVS